MRFRSHFLTMTAALLLSASLSQADPATPAAEAYRYNGSRFRDPFIPLIGSAVQISVVEEGTIDLENLVAKGILEDKQGSRMALLASSSGASYLVQRGRVLDGRGKAIPGITSVVKKKSVILITSDKIIKEIKMEVIDESGAKP